MQIDQVPDLYHTFVKPLVSIITPTWENDQILLHKCIPSIRNQTYPHIEHIVVSDGLNPELKGELDELYYFDNYIQLGRNWSDDILLPRKYIARMVGTYKAQGYFMTYINDVETMSPDYIDEMVRCLLSNEVDFVVKKGDPILPQNLFHKTSLLKMSDWRQCITTEQLIEAWENEGYKKYICE